jgi:YggT family protein
MATLAYIIDWLVRILTLVVIVDVVLGYFMAPYHPVRQALDRMVNPLLGPIRRVMPNTGPVDFSPVVLVLALLILNQILQSLLR